MKFATQHKNVKASGNLKGFYAHREGNVTWRTSGEGKLTPIDVITHPSVASAKKWMNEVKAH